MGGCPVLYQGNTQAAMLDTEGPAQNSDVFFAVDFSIAWHDNGPLAVPDRNEKHSAIGCFKCWKDAGFLPLVVNVD